MSRRCKDLRTVVDGANGDEHGVGGRAVLTAEVVRCEIVGVDGQNRSAREVRERVESQSVKRGVDIVQRAFEGHRRVRRTVAGCESQTGRRRQRQDAVCDREGDLHVARAGIGVADCDAVVVRAIEDERAVFVDCLSAGHGVDGVRVIVVVDRAVGGRDIERDSG